MSESEANLENLSEAFDKLNDVREQSLTISREIVRECSKSIRNVHRNDISDAEKHIKSAQEKLNDLKSICSEISEISYAGYVCLLYTSPSPRDAHKSRMPSSA